MVYLVDFENVTSAGISGIQRLTKEDKVYIFYTVNASSLSFAAHMNLLSSPAEIIYYNVASGGKNALDFQLSSFLGYLISQGEEKDFCIISNDKGYEYVRTFWEKNGLVTGVSINGAPSINRALIPAERPFAAKIQQGINDRVQKDSIKQTETAETVEIPENKPIRKPVVQEAAAAAALPASNSEEAEEKKPRKRGRPKGKKSVSNPNISAAANHVRSMLEISGITESEKITEIVELLKKSAGKQQFYREIIKVFGMEKGVVVYKTIRPEYTNLTKLIKQ